jgi:hypothetical protein
VGYPTRPFHLFASDIVIEEAGKGDDIAATRRLKALDEIPLLALTDEILLSSKALVAHLRAKKHEGNQQVVDLRSMKQTAEQKVGLDRG